MKKKISKIILLAMLFVMLGVTSIFAADKTPLKSSYFSDKYDGVVQVSNKSTLHGRVEKQIKVNVYLNGQINRKYVYHIDHLYYYITSANTVKVVDSDMYLAYLTIPEVISMNGTELKVTAIGEKAFKGQKYLQKAVIPDSVRVIGVSAFEGCSKLSGFDMSRGLKKIDDRAFADCTSLRELEVHSNSLSVIGKEAFKNCRKFKSLYTETAKLNKIGKKAFAGTKQPVNLYVRSGKVDAYQKLAKRAGYNSKRVCVKGLY